MRGACARSNKDDRPFQHEEKDDERAIWSAGAGCVGRRVAAGARPRVQARANGRPGGAHGPGRGQRRARAGDRRHGGKGKAAAGAHAGGQQARRARGGGGRLPRGEKRRPEHDRPVHRGVAANAPRQRGGENHAPRSDADRAPGAGARGHSGEGRCAVQDVRRFHRRREQEPRAAQAVGRLQHQPRQRRAPAPAEIHGRALGLHLVPRRRRAHRGAPGRTRRYHGDRAGGGGRAYPRRQHARARADQRASPSRIPQRADLEGSRVRRAGRPAGPRRGCAAGNSERERRVLGGLFPQVDAHAVLAEVHRGQPVRGRLSERRGAREVLRRVHRPHARNPEGRRRQDGALMRRRRQAQGGLQMITSARRNAVAAGVVAALAIAAPSSSAFANQHPHPHKGSLEYLDRNSYAKNMRVLGVFQLGEERGHKLQMMAIGPRRLILQNGDVIDVSDPRAPKLVKHGAFRGSQLQVAYNKKLGKWILVTGASSPITSTTATAPNGEYDDPSLIEKTKQGPGLRGIRIWDATDPANIVLLSEFSTDGGFINMESPIRWHGNGIMVVDVSDPASPKQVAMWWVPGQRTGEEAQYKAWREHGDRVSFTSLHGPMYVPKKVEDGGKLGYSAYGSFGMLIHDLSDIRNPKLLGRFAPDYKYTRGTAIAFHTIDVARLDRGFVITNPETLSPDCNETYVPSWIVDVRDPAAPKAISRLPVPTPPLEAPYKTFCDKRGRFGPHNPPHIKAPGKPDPNFTYYAHFNAGLQCYDIRDPKNPRIVAYFIPPQGGELDKWNSYNRTVDNVLVEWDRRIIWVASDTGLYALEAPALGRPVTGPMPVKQWSLPGLNAGHP